MKECPTCHRCFADHFNHCGDDGALLVSTIAGDIVLEGRYELKKRLGEGGMGAVYEARHIFLKTVHAVKIILPEFLVSNDSEFVRRFRQEAMTAANIRHRNVIRVTDYGVTNGIMPFLVMDFIRGRLLQDILAQEQRLSPERSLELMEPIMAGVGAAHRLGIVHRDLKPLNIIIEDELPLRDAVKVLDFGLAKIKAGELLGSFAAAKSSGVMGSPPYMAPEQWSDEEFDSRTDIYSLGIILYQMLTGTVPFKGPSAPSIMKKHLMDDPPRFAEAGVFVPAQVEAVVRHSLEKSPANRPQSVDEFISELRAAINEANTAHERARSITPVSLLDTFMPGTVEAQIPQSHTFDDSETLPRDSGAERQLQEAEAAARIAEEELREEEERRAREEEERRAAAHAAEQERLRLEQEHRRLEEEEAARKRAEEARLAAEEEERKRAAEEQERQREAEEAAARAAEEERRRKEEEDLVARAIEAARRAEEEQRLKEEEERKLAEEAERQRQEEVARKRAAEEAERRRKEEEARQKAAEEERLRQEAERKRLEEAQRLAEERQRRLELERAAAKEEKRRAAELAAEQERLRLEEEARRRAEAAEAQRRAEEEARQRAEEEARRLAAEEEERRKAEAAKQLAAEAEERRRAEESRRAEEEERRLRAEEARRAEEAVRQRAEEEAARKRAEEARLAAEEEERKRAAEEQERQRKAEEAAARAVEEERRRKEEEDLVARAIEAARRAQEEQRLKEEEERKLAEEAERQRQEEVARKRAEEEAEPQEFIKTIEVQRGVEAPDLLPPIYPNYETKKSRVRVITLATVAVLLGFTGILYFLLSSREQRPEPANPGIDNSTMVNANINVPSSSQADIGSGGNQPYRPELVAIPGGKFLMGRNDVSTPDAFTQYPRHEVVIKPFLIDQVEVTNAEYADFVRETHYKSPKHWSGDNPPIGMEMLPVVNVSFQDAQAFAKWRSKRDGVTYRLPREEEWEFAARGTENFLYPWGNEWADDRVNLNGDGPRPVGSYPQGASVKGVRDMIGNVWEWTSSEASLYPGNDKLAPVEKGWIVVRGGSYLSMDAGAVKKRGGKEFPATWRQWQMKTTKSPTLGFRLVRDLP